MEKKISDTKNYVKDLIEKGATPSYFKKYAKIQAKRALGGEKITTILSDGTVETTNIANKGDWIATNPGGEQYIIPGDKFEKRYEIETGVDGKHAPKGAPILALQINEDISILTSWGEEQHLKIGSWLNITDSKDIYGIAPEEFKNTYAKCDKNGIFKDAHLREIFGQLGKE